MSLLLATALAAAIQPSCSWDHPGRNPYTGSPAAAIDRYTDIPASVRSTLKRRLADRQPDDTVSITRDHIAGKSQYDTTIRDMHFGAASVCGTVTRTKWDELRAEPAAVYCEGEHCILVPKICGNVSRITRLAPAVAQAKPPKKPQEFSDISLVDADAPDLDDVTSRLARTMSDLGLDDFVPEGATLADADQRARDMAHRFGPGGAGADGIDSVAAPVPEAETWAMLLSGLGMMGWLARRRASAAAKAAANAAT